MNNHITNPELIILDVGHGNSAILIDTDSTIVIDCAPGNVLAEALNELAITEIDYVLISHADKDHIGGLGTLVLNFNVKKVFINTDSAKTSKVWKTLITTLDLAKKLKGTITHPALTTSDSKTFKSGQTEIEILAPSATKMAMVGPGGTDIKGRKITANTMSVVVGILHNSHRVALLTADLDNVGLDNMLEENSNIEADVLVFPHHGGRPCDADSEIFANKLCTEVKPKQIVFSFSRNKFTNPRDEIIKGCRSAVPQAHISCTQLSRRCEITTPISTPQHLIKNMPAKGMLKNECCTGTIHLIMGSPYIPNPSLSSHSLFITRNVSHPLCK